MTRRGTDSIGRREFEQSQRKLTAADRQLHARIDRVESNLKLMLEHLVTIREAMERGFAAIHARIHRLESMMMTFVRTQGGLNREHKDMFRDHDARLRALESGRTIPHSKH